MLCVTKFVCCHRSVSDAHSWVKKRRSHKQSTGISENSLWLEAEEKTTVNKHKHTHLCRENEERKKTSVNPEKWVRWKKNNNYPRFHKHMHTNACTSVIINTFRVAGHKHRRQQHVHTPEQASSALTCEIYTHTHACEHYTWTKWMDAWMVGKRNEKKKKKLT